MTPTTTKNQPLATGPKKAYTKPRLIKHGRVARLTLKGGSAFDALTAVNNFQA